MGRPHPGSSLGSPIDIQSIGTELRIYGEIDDPAMRYMNPSIAFDGDRLWIAIRSCNFAVHRDGEWYFRDGSAYSRTEVIGGEVNPETLEVFDLNKLKLSNDSPKTILTAGLEDVRLFCRKDGMHAIGFESDRLSRSLHNASAGMAEYLIDGNKLVYLRSLDKPNKEIVEKNWSPTDKPSKNFDFTYSPTQTWKDGKVFGEAYTGNVHGGTQLFKQKDGTFLSIVHEKNSNGARGSVYDKYVYTHYLAKHDVNGIITQLSEPFNFGTGYNIEFAAGLVEYDGSFIVSFGIHDCKYALAKIKKDRLMSLFRESA